MRKCTMKLSQTPSKTLRCSSITDRSRSKSINISQKKPTSKEIQVSNKKDSKIWPRTTNETMRWRPKKFHVASAKKEITKQ